MKKLRLFDSLKFVVAAIVCTFILNIAHAATLPAGYTELEYLESTGTQYIDTGYSPNTQNVKYVYSVQSTSTDTAEQHPARIAGGRIQIYRKTSVWDIYESSPSVSSRAIPNLGIMDKVDFVVENNYDNSLAIWANNINVTGNYTTRSNTYTSSIILFAFNSAGSNKFIGRVYYFRVYENGVLRFNAVPARRDSDGMLGMYDLADANPATAFHTNAGTGTFIAGEYQIKIATTKYNEESFAPVKTDLSAAVNAVEYVVSNTMTQAQAIDTIATSKQTRPDEGCDAKYCLLVEDEDGTPHWYPIAGANGVAHNLPAGYTELQYLESNTGTYINTGFGFLTTDTLEADLMVMNPTSTKHMISAANNPGSGFFQIAQTDALLLADFGTPATGRVSTSTISSVNNKVHLKAVGTGEFYVNDNLVGTATGNDFVGSGSIGLRLFGNTGEKGIRIYSFKILGKVNFIPVRRNSDGVLGMYDLMDSNPATAFHTNAGTGTFTAGPDM